MTSEGHTTLTVYTKVGTKSVAETSKPLQASNKSRLIIRESTGNFHGRVKHAEHRDPAFALDMEGNMPGDRK